MVRQLLLISLLFFLLISCQKDELENKILNLEKFQVAVPANWNSFSDQGYDSEVGMLSDGKDELVFDYGWFAYNFNYETAATHTRTTTTIAGKPALIVQPKEKGKGLTGIYIMVDDQNKLTLYGQDITNESVVLKIFNSVRF